MTNGEAVARAQMWDLRQCPRLGFSKQCLAEHEHLKQIVGQVVWHHEDGHAQAGALSCRWQAGMEEL